MAKFCTKCGKRLEEGQVCDCGVNNSTPSNFVTQQTSVASQTVSNTSVSNSIDFNRGLNDYINIVKGIFVKPADTIKTYAQSNKGLLGIIAMIINCLISGLFFYFICDKSLSGIAGLFLGGYSSLLSSAYSIPFGETFLMGTVFMASWFLVCTLVILLIANPILKDKMDIKKAFALVGSCSVFTTLTTLLAIICVFVSVPFAIIIMLLGLIFYLTHLYQGLSDITNINKNKLVYVFVPAVAVATLVMVYIVPKLFS